MSTGDNFGLMFLRHVTSLYWTIWKGTCIEIKFSFRKFLFWPYRDQIPHFTKIRYLLCEWFWFIPAVWRTLSIILAAAYIYFWVNEDYIFSRNNEIRKIYVSRVWVLDWTGHIKICSCGFIWAIFYMWFFSILY